MVVGDGAFARIGGDHGRRDEFGERREAVACFGIMHALTGPKNRMLGRKQHLDGFLDRVRIGRAALHRHRRVIERALEFGLGHLLRQLNQHRARLSRAHRVIGAPHQVGQFLHVVRQRRPLGHRAIDIRGAKGRAHILPRQRQAARNDEHGNVLGKSLRDAGERVLDAGAGLRAEHAVPLSALDAAIAVGDADADAFLPAQDRTNVDRRAGLDHVIAWIAGEKFGALDFQDLGDNFGAIHGVSLSSRRASGGHFGAAIRIAIHRRLGLTMRQSERVFSAP